MYRGWSAAQPAGCERWVGHPCYSTLPTYSAALLALTRQRHGSLFGGALRLHEQDFQFKPLVAHKFQVLRKGKSSLDSIGKIPFEILGLIQSFSYRCFLLRRREKNSVSSFFGLRKNELL